MVLASRTPGGFAVMWGEGGDGELRNGLSTADLKPSFYLKNPQPLEVVATAAFGQVAIPVAVDAGGLFATQFHQDKSP